MEFVYGAPARGLTAVAHGTSALGIVVVYEKPVVWTAVYSKIHVRVYWLGYITKYLLARNLCCVMARSPNSPKMLDKIGYDDITLPYIWVLLSTIPVLYPILGAQRAIFQNTQTSGRPYPIHTWIHCLYLAFRCD